MRRTRTRFCWLFAFASAFALQGCAAVLGSKTAVVPAVSEPPGADVYLNGARIGTTPITVRLLHKKSHTLIFRKAGYQDASCTLVSRTDGGWVILDVLSGLIPILIDAATGDWSQISDKNCSVTLPAIGAQPGLASAALAPEASSISRNGAARAEQSSDPPARALAGGRALPPAPPEAEHELVDEQSKERRRLLIGDVTRVGLITAIEKGPPGVLRVAVGEGFYSGSNKDYYFGRIQAAYYTWTQADARLVIELWDQGLKFGEYVDGSFLMGPRYSKPRGCDSGCATAVPANTSAPIVPVSAPAHPASTPGAAVSPTQESRIAPSGHTGFHVALGVGAGWLGVSCDGCGGIERDGGLSGFVSLAGSVGGNTLIGIESTGWRRDYGGTTGQGYSLMGQITGYLNETSGVFVATGLGLVGYREDGGGFGSVSANGFGFAGRLGVEMPLGRSAALVPYVGYVTTFSGAELEGFGDINISNIQIGVALGVH
jgi:hypothetical protein